LFAGAKKDRQVTRQRENPTKEATNVFYQYTYEGSVDNDYVSDPEMKTSILAQINHFG
jgi:hypothetical protein